jgi:hypothetical protein
MRFDGQIFFRPSAFIDGDRRALVVNGLLISLKTVKMAYIKSMEVL